MLESLGKSYFAYKGKACEKHELMLLAVIIILHFTNMLEHVSVCFEIVTCHYLTQWNKILKLPNTTLKKNVGSQAHKLTVNFLKEHPFKYIWICKVKSENGIWPKNLELFLIHLIVDIYI